MATKAVWKFPVTVDDEFEMTMPAGARILSVQAQRGEPCMWALVDPSAQRVTKRFRLAGTGHAIEGADGLSFVGTFQIYDGDLVFHLFERAA